MAEEIPVVETDAGESEPVAATGDVDGDGAGEVIVARKAASGSERDRIEVYRIGADGLPSLQARFAAFGDSGMSSSAALAVGDVDPYASGDEIVVAEDGSTRRAMTVRVFERLGTGAPRLALEFRAVRPRFAARRPLALVLGDVVAGDAHPGQEIVIGDRRGRVYVYGLRVRIPAYGVREVKALVLRRMTAFPDAPRSSADRLAAGDLMPEIEGDEIAVGDDGTRQDGMVRVLDSRHRHPVLEFATFEQGSAPSGVELRIADVVAAVPGAELIVGQGSAGGRLLVFSVAGGRPRLLFEVPGAALRGTSYAHHLAAADLIGRLPGTELAVVRSGTGVPLQVFSFNSGEHQRPEEAGGDAQTSGLFLAGGEPAVITHLTAGR